MVKCKEKLLVDIEGALIGNATLVRQMLSCNGGHDNGKPYRDNRKIDNEKPYRDNR